MLNPDGQLDRLQLYHPHFFAYLLAYFIFALPTLTFLLYYIYLFYLFVLIRR